MLPADRCPTCHAPRLSPEKVQQAIAETIALGTPRAEDNNYGAHACALGRVKGHLEGLLFALRLSNYCTCGSAGKVAA